MSLRAGMVDTELLRELTENLRAEREILDRSVPTFEDQPGSPSGEQLLVNEDGVWRLATFGDADPPETIYERHVDQWQAFADATREALLFGWAASLLPPLAPMVFDASAARGTCFHRFKRKHGLSGEHYADRVRFRPGRYDAERRAELSALMAIPDLLDLLFAFGNLMNDWQETFPPYPLTDTSGSPLAQPRQIDGQPTDVWWTGTTGEMITAMRGILDRIRGFVVDPETLQYMFDECWKKFARGKQAKFKGE